MALKVTLLVIYRTWARDDRQRLNDAGDGSYSDESGTASITRRDIEVLVQEMFSSNGEVGMLPSYERLRRDCKIEGRDCRGEDRLEVRTNLLETI